MKKNLKFLQNIYKKFLSFWKKDFFVQIKKFSTSLRGLKIPSKILEKFFENYEACPFLVFLKRVKDVIYSKSIDEVLLRNFMEDWEAWRYFVFLQKEGLVCFNKEGKIKFINKILKESIPPFFSEEEIKRALERKLKIKIRPKDFVFRIFEKEFKFFPKQSFDQLPISQSSAIFIVHKIFDYLPLFENFLFVGDDDYISLILCLTEPRVKCLVCDLDERILKNIELVAKKYNLKIQTKKVDFAKGEKIGENFVGFLTSPIYTEEGTKKFVKFGKEQLGKDGGFAFLNLGDEAIGNRILFLQDFFTKENLIVIEKIIGKTFYPQMQLYSEDKEIFKRFSRLFKTEKIMKIPKIGTTLYVFEYLPFVPEKIKFKKSIYAYL